jgi:predicted nuclease of predicted toxin-antitoxin system
VRDSDAGSNDERVLELATKEKRILLTNDKGFGEMVFMQKRVVAGIVLFRVRGQNVTEKIKLLENLLQGYADKLPGRFVVVTKKKIRFIPMEGV